MTDFRRRLRPWLNHCILSPCLLLHHGRRFSECWTSVCLDVIVVHYPWTHQTDPREFRVSSLFDGFGTLSPSRRVYSVFPVHPQTTQPDRSSSRGPVLWSSVCSSYRRTTPSSPPTYLRASSTPTLHLSRPTTFRTTQYGSFTPNRGDHCEWARLSS